MKSPLTLLSLSVSTQDEDTDDPATVSVSAIIAGHARISPINEKISPPRPISLDIQTNYHIKATAASATASAEANGKIDREQQTPQEPQVRYISSEPLEVLKIWGRWGEESNNFVGIICLSPQLRQG